MRRTLAVVGLVTALALGAIGGALASRTSRSVDPNLSSANAIRHVQTTYGENLVGTSGPWTKVASIGFAIPNGERDLVIARFDGDSYCEPNTPGIGSGSCQLRFRAIKGSTKILLKPESMTTVLTVESGGIGEDDYSLTMEKSRELGPGHWLIVVQHRVTDPSIYFGIYSHHFTVERAPV